MAAPRICKIDDCGKRVFGHGWCYMHYYRWYKHGDPRGGSTFKGHPAAFYQTLLGEADREACIDWPFHKQKSGYGVIHIENQKHRVHRVLCEEVHGPAPSPEHQAAHNCGNAWCVNRHHVEWKTAAENSADKVLHGTAQRGERAYQARLTETDIRSIRRLHGACTQQSLADRFGVSTSNISAIQRRKSWAWLPD